MCFIIGTTITNTKIILNVARRTHLLVNNFVNINNNNNLVNKRDQCSASYVEYLMRDERFFIQCFKINDNFRYNRMAIYDFTAT